MEHTPRIRILITKKNQLDEVCALLEQVAKMGKPLLIIAAGC